MEFAELVYWHQAVQQCLEGDQIRIATVYCSESELVFETEDVDAVVFVPLDELDDEDIAQRIRRAYANA